MATTSAFRDPQDDLAAAVSACRHLVSLHGAVRWKNCPERDRQPASAGQFDSDSQARPSVGATRPDVGEVNSVLGGAEVGDRHDPRRVSGESDEFGQ